MSDRCANYVILIAVAATMGLFLSDPYLTQGFRFFPWLFAASGLYVIARLGLRYLNGDWRV